MVEVRSYPQGVPSWIDVSTTDLGAAISFYSALFGWEAEDQGPEAGHYHLFRVRGLEVAGAGPVAAPGQPSAWTTYIAVDDADAATTGAAAAGGEVLVPPMDVLDSGRMALIADPTGAVVGLWQANRHVGARLVNEPGTWIWSECSTPDPARASAFYATAFDWDVVPMDESGDYLVASVGGRAVAGVLPMAGDGWEGVPPMWTPYFADDDVDALAERVASLGGTVIVAPFDTPAGRTAVVTDPTGAAFAVITPTAVDDTPPG